MVAHNVRSTHIRITSMLLSHHNAHVFVDNGFWCCTKISSVLLHKYRIPPTQPQSCRSLSVSLLSWFNLDLLPSFPSRFSILFLFSVLLWVGMSVCLSRTIYVILSTRCIFFITEYSFKYRRYSPNVCLLSNIPSTYMVVFGLTYFFLNQ